MNLSQKLTTCSVGILFAMNGCGTQIGNPTGAGMVRILDNSKALTTVVNASFMQLVDGINMGDYGYSLAESRVSTDRTCQNQPGSKLSLINKAETKHSVIDDSEEWYAKSDLIIKRSYQDTWSQNAKRVACDPESSSISFDLRTLSGGSLKLNSLVEEDLARNLFMSEKKLNLELRHNMVTSKKGQRSLELLEYTAGAKESSITAQLMSSMESVVSLNLAEEGAPSAKLSLIDRTPLNFTIYLDRNKQWDRYEIAEARQDFAIAETGEILRWDFKNVVFSRASSCIPESGRMTATVVRPNLPQVRYSIDFLPNTPVILKREDGSDTLILAPFACVLKER